MLIPPPSARALRWEPWLVWLVGMLAFASVPVYLGHIGLSSDALNHHIYLGWVAEQPRFDRDLAAAGSQAYQYPYLYWPVYKLAMAGASGVTAGVVLALLQALAVPPVWIVARWVCPGVTWLDLLLRLMAVVLAFLGGLSLSLLDSTSNDMLATIPYLWAVALGALALSMPERVGARRLTYASGLMAGISVAFKLSNGPLVLVLPLLWCLNTGGPREALRRLIGAGLAVALGCLLAYGGWGWQLWQYAGNPIYPFYDDHFDGLRALLGWRP